MGNVLAVNGATVKSPQILPPAPTSILSAESSIVMQGKKIGEVQENELNEWNERNEEEESGSDDGNQGKEMEEHATLSAADLSEEELKEVPPDPMQGILKFFEDMIPNSMGMEESLIDVNNFRQADNDGKFDLMVVANKLNMQILKNNAKFELAMTENENGIFPRLRESEATTDLHDTNIVDYQKKVTKLEDEVAQLKGFIQVQDRQIMSLKQELTKIKARSMRRNIVVAGIEGDERGENCKEKSKVFLNTQLHRKTEIEEIKVAHRLGPVAEGKVRPMVIKCTDKLRSEVFAYTKNLKDKKNTLGQSFFVDPQMPEEMLAEKRGIAAKVKRLRRINAELAPGQKMKIEVKDRNLYVNNVQQKRRFTAPTVTELLNVDKKDMQRITDISLQESSMKSERGSLFCAYARKVTSPSEIRDCYIKVKHWHPEADHVIMATQIQGEIHSVDDGEWNAGIKLESLLEKREEKNVVVFVAREFGSTKIGSKRFQLIKEVAEEALNKL